MNFPVTERQGTLRQSGQVTLNSSGNGTVYLQPTSSHMRWEVTSVVVSTNQAANATVVPTATLALNSNDLSTMSISNSGGQTYSGNNDTFTGSFDVGPCDFIGIIFSPATGTSGASLSGVICSATVYGTKYTRVA